MIKSELAEVNRLPVLSAEIVESLLINGDLSKLNSTQKVQYYNTICSRIGLDPATQPFKLLSLQGKQILYADKGAAQQLCKIYDISTEITGRRTESEVYTVTTRAKMPTDAGERYTDEDGSVNIAGLKGNDLANAFMKASTKSKRRAVLALCGLGLLDETEVETISGAKTVELISENITEKQASQMLDVLDNLPNAEEKRIKFLKYMAVADVKDILAQDFDKGMEALKASQSKAVIK